MALISLKLKGFVFPADLANSKANFRLFFYLRHVAEASDDWVTAEGVSPSLSGYWECDPTKAHQHSASAKYIRDPQASQFSQLSPWDELVLIVRTKKLIGLRMMVFDVNRKDWTDTLREIGSGIIGSVFDVAGNVNLPVVGSLSGSLLEHFKTSVLDSFAVKDDLLFAVDCDMTQVGSAATFTLADGGYKVTLAVDTVNVSPGPVQQGTVPSGSSSPIVDKVFSRTLK